jgi:hypothetical protein
MLQERLGQVVSKGRTSLISLYMSIIFPPSSLPFLGQKTVSPLDVLEMAIISFPLSSSKRMYLLNTVTVVIQAKCLDCPPLLHRERAVAYVCYN